MNLCECNCGLPAPIASRNANAKEKSRGRSFLKGQPMRFRQGHNLRGTKQTLTHKVNRVRSRHKREPQFSPYIPDSLIFFCSRAKRWKGYDKNGKSKYHSKLVYEYHNGPVPNGYDVHHKSGFANTIESDNPSNLIAIPRIWNWKYFPLLAEGFGIKEAEVTKLYVELLYESDPSKLFGEICLRLYINNFSSGV